MDRPRLREVWTVGAQAGVSSGGDPQGPQVSGRLCHTPGRRRLPGQLTEEASKRVARDIVRVREGSMF
eukprot:12886287-Prorocentrum_lima.AAC.1